MGESASRRLLSQGHLSNNKIPPCALQEPTIKYYTENHSTAMTRSHTNTASPRTDDTDSLLSEEEFENMGWSSDVPGIDSDLNRIRVIASSLSDTGIMDLNEAQAFAFHEIAGIGRQRTAKETGMSTSEVDHALRSANRKINGARECVEILDDCGC